MFYLMSGTSAIFLASQYQVFFYDYDAMKVGKGTRLCERGHYKWQHNTLVVRFQTDQTYFTGFWHSQKLSHNDI